MQHPPPRANAAPSTHASRATFAPATAELESVYQPIVSLDDRQVQGFEALTRSSVAGTTVPDMFSAAESLNATVEFDWRCRLIALEGALAAGFPSTMPLFVNAEPVALDAPPPADALPLLAEASRLSITIEITERHLMRDPAGLLRAVEHARDLGWRIAVDDVGSDSSSLALLPLLRPDVVKLDMRLVQGRSTASTAAIVAAVEAESDRTGALVLAEGIENERHEQTARDMGAAWGQGWFYGVPGALPAFAEPRGTLRPRYADPAVTVRAPAAVTPYGLTHALGTPRRASAELLTAMEEDLLRGAASVGSSTVVLATGSAAAGLTSSRVERLDALATHTALTALFHTGGAPERSHFRAVEVGEDEPLARERSTIVVAPLLTAALIALETGRAADGSPSYDYRLTYDRNLVLDAATVLIRRIPGDFAPPARSGVNTELR